MSANANDTETVEKIAGRITAGLTEASERILSLAAKIKEAKDEIPADQLKELGDITKLLSELTQRYPSPKAGVEKSAETEFVPKAITERADGLADRLAAALNDTGTPAAPPPSAAPPIPAAAVPPVVPPVETPQEAETVDWPPDLAAESKPPETPGTDKT